MLCLICSNVYHVKRDCCPVCGVLRVGTNRHVDWHHARKYELVNVSGDSRIADLFRMAQAVGNINRGLVDGDAN